MKLSWIIKHYAKDALKFQANDGSFPAGHNGPWNDEDTPVRTTAHWAITMYKAFELTNDKVYEQAALKCCDFLLSKAARPYGKTFYCRITEKKTSQNGLIGQAWAIEPLIEIGIKTNNQEYIQTAIDVILLHPYSYSHHMWMNLWVDGRMGNIQVTLNQQIRFGVLANKLIEFSEDIKRHCDDFFKYLSTNVHFLKPGLIRHRNENIHQTNIINLIKDIRRFYFSKQYKKQLLERSIGYQSFILSAMISYLKDSKKQISDFPFIQKAINYSLNKTNTAQYKNNPYAYGYNMTGIELAIIAEFIGDDDSAKWWLKQQFEHTINRDNGELMAINMADTLTSKARLYELCALNNDYEIEI